MQLARALPSWAVVVTAFVTLGCDGDSADGGAPDLSDASTDIVVATQRIGCVR